MLNTHKINTHNLYKKDHPYHTKHPIMHHIIHHITHSNIHQITHTTSYLPHVAMHIIKPSMSRWQCIHRTLPTIGHVSICNSTHSNSCVMHDWVMGCSTLCIHLLCLCVGGVGGVWMCMVCVREIEVCGCVCVCSSQHNTSLCHDHYPCHLHTTYIPTSPPPNPPHIYLTHTPYTYLTQAMMLWFCQQS